MSKSSRLDEIVNMAGELLVRGEYDDAAVTFEKALAIKEDASVRNQLALCYYYLELPERAFHALQPGLVKDQSQPFHHPFSYSLASIVLAEMGRFDEAFLYLRTAIEGYAEGERLLAEAGLPFDSVGGYLAMLMKASGELEQHRLLLDIYDKWKKDYLSWECVYYAGAAAFNMKDFRSASEHWGSIKRIIPVCEQMQRIALMMEQGELPLFGLEYHIVNNHQLQDQLETALADDEERERFMGCGYARMLLLGHLLGHDSLNEEIAEALLEALINWTGEWGQELGLRLQENNNLGPAVHRAVSKHLAASEAPQGDHPETDHEETSHLAEDLECIQVLYGPEMEAIYVYASGLIEQGRQDEALALWEDVFYNEKKFYPPAMLSMTDIYMQMKRYEEASQILDLLEQIDQAEQGLFIQDIYFKRAFLAWCQGNPVEAWQHLDRLDIDRLSEEEHERLLDFREQLSGAGIENMEIQPSSGNKQQAAGIYSESKRRAIEDKALPDNARLVRGLKNMPVEWIDAICLNLGIIGLPRRSQREKQIAEWLLNEKLLERLVDTLDSDQKSLLSFLSENGGCAGMDELEPLFGSLQGESNDWMDEGTSTTLGTLWSLALVMVGRDPAAGQRSRIAIIPEDMRMAVKRMIIA